MELDELVTLKVVQKRMVDKIYTYRDWPSFVTWIKGITAIKFKAFVLACLDDSVTNGDAKKADLLEIKSSIEG